MLRAMRRTLLLIALLLSACGGRGGRVPPPVTGPDGTPAGVVDFEAEGLDGKPFRLRDLRGKVVLVNYFATWCGPCMQEVPELNDLAFGDTPLADFVVVGVSVDLDPSVLLPPWVELMGLDYRIVLADKGSIQGNTPFGRMSAIPASFLIDEGGRHVESFLGLVPIQYLRRRVESLGKGKR
jgi:peroxiredoxin